MVLIREPRGEYSRKHPMVVSVAQCSRHTTYQARHTDGKTSGNTAMIAELVTPLVMWYLGGTELSTKQDELGVFDT